MKNRMKTPREIEYQVYRIEVLAYEFYISGKYTVERWRHILSIAPRIAVHYQINIEKKYRLKYGSDKFWDKKAPREIYAVW